VASSSRALADRNSRRGSSEKTTISLMKKLHPEAAAAYDRKVAPLPERLKPAPEHRPLQSRSKDAHISAQITDEDMEPGSLREYHTDFTGEPQACYFESGRGFMG